MRTNIRIKPKTHNYLISYSCFKDSMQLFGQSISIYHNHKINEKFLEKLKKDIIEEFDVESVIFISISEF